MLGNRTEHFPRAPSQHLIFSAGNRWRPFNGLWFVRPECNHPNRESHKVGGSLNNSKCRVEASTHKEPQSQGKYACADINSKPQNHSFDVFTNPNAVISGKEKNCHQYNSLGYSQISFQVGSIRSYIPVRQNKCPYCDRQENRSKSHQDGPSCDTI